MTNQSTTEQIELTIEAKAKKRLRKIRPRMKVSGGRLKSLQQLIIAKGKKRA